MDLSNKVILVTGAASGIGQATAYELAASSATVILSDINQERGQALAQKIQQESNTAVRFETCDVCDASRVKQLIENVVATEGRLDCAINNAGINHPLSHLINCDDELFDKVIDVNLKGTFYCMKYQIMAMLAQGSGCVVNIASIAGLKSAPAFAPYAATKHGVVGLTRSAAVEYGSKNIRINAVCPGYIDTPMYQRAASPDRELEAKIVKTIPMKRIGQPEEIARAIAWLCSDSATYMTGHTMVLDGGITC